MIYCVSLVSARQHVRMMRSVTRYGSKFAAGRRSSKYPCSWFATWRGMRMLRPRSPTPHVHSSMQLVSCMPVMRCSLNSPYTAMCSAWDACSFSHASMIALMASSLTAGDRMAAVLKFVCPPDPFHMRSGLG